MASTLEQSLRSVFEQITHEYEVVVVDDGSSDNSLEILRSLSSIYPSLRIIPLRRFSGRKLGETRNISIRAARGDFIILHIDTDDVWDFFIPTFSKLFIEIGRRIHDFDFMLSGIQIQVETSVGQSPFIY